MLILCGWSLLFCVGKTRICGCLDNCFNVVLYWDYITDIINGCKDGGYVMVCCPG